MENTIFLPCFNVKEEKMHPSNYMSRATASRVSLQSRRTSKKGGGV